MKTFKTIFFLILLPFYGLAQQPVPVAVDPVTGLPVSANTNLNENFYIDPATGLPVRGSNLKKPLQGLDKMADEADLVLKGRVISSRAETNSSFPSWGNPHATKFAVISIFKGNVISNELIFWHCASGPMAWGGGAEPSFYQLNTNQSYLVFARKLDKSDYLFPAPPDAAKRPNEFRQLYSGGIFRTLDERPLVNLSISNALWLELNLLLNNTNPTNQLYAIGEFDNKSLADRQDDWLRIDFFNRNDVLRALLPLTTNSNELVACRAISCFAVNSNSIVNLKSFTDALIKVANESRFSSCRLEAINSLSGIDEDMVSNSLSQLLKDPDENIRVGAVRLLPRFPDEFAEHALRERADDKSANVRSVVADVIGDGKYVRVLPTLEKLFADPVGKNSLIKPLTIENLEAGQRWNNIGDVHTSAGLALVKFDLNQVSDILKSNLDDAGFHINFVAKLAQEDAESWLPELVSILETRYKYVENIAKLSGDDPENIPILMVILF